MIGSSTFSISVGSGQREGLSTSTTLPSREGDPVPHPRRGSDQVQLVLPLQPLLDDLHVQQAKETAAEAEPERRRALRLEEEGGIVQPQLFKRIPKQRVLVRVDGVKPGEDHRLDVLEAGERRSRGPLVIRDRIADLRVRYILDIRHEEADFTSRQLLDLHRLRREYAHRLDVEGLAVRHQPDLHALTHPPMDDAGQHDHTPVRVEPRVEDESLQRIVRVALRAEAAG